MSAMLRAKKDSTQKKTNREKVAKAPRNSHATGEAKKLRISRPATARATDLSFITADLPENTFQCT